MRQFVDGIQQALEQQNWLAALYVALTVPDICARIESDDGRTDRSRFVAWFDRYLADRYKSPIGPRREDHVFLSGNDCYALRCALLHEGGSEISQQRCRETLDRVHFAVTGAHCNQFNAVLQLDVRRFCQDVCVAVETWHGDFLMAHADKSERLKTLLQIPVGPHTIKEGVRFE